MMEQIVNAFESLNQTDSYKVKHMYLQDTKTGFYMVLQGKIPEEGEEDTRVKIPLWLTDINGEMWHYQSVSKKWRKIEQESIVEKL